MTAIGGRYLLTLPMGQGASQVEIRVRLDFVEVWHHEHCGGVLDRAVLHDWLGEPRGALLTDEVALVAMRGGQVAFKLHGHGTWHLNQSAVAELRACI
jgi:hypothetical protein